MSKENALHKYRMRMSLNVLNHLGINLYSNIPAVLSEVVANAYDADATKVDIDFDEVNETITITDNGHGMTLDDINDKFLFVGYQRRLNGEEKSHELHRPVMGRKGIGKLSLFSIADNIEVYSTRYNEETKRQEKHGLILNRPQIVEKITKSETGEYYPEEIKESQFEIAKGTRIVISEFKKNINQTAAFLRRRLARRFTVIDDDKFQVCIDSEPITIEDRDFFSKIQLLWLVGDEPNIYEAKTNIQNITKLNGKIDGTEYVIRGWIGSVVVPSDLEQDKVNNNKISLICRGKMAQEDILESFNEGGIYATYLIGEIHADFLDDDHEQDIATSSRQKINEEDPRYKELISFVFRLLKKIQGTWTDKRKEVAVLHAVDNAKMFNPAIYEWFESLSTDARKDHARQLFATIDTLHFTPGEEVSKKKELYKQGILAFEKLRLKESLHDLHNLKSFDDIKLSSIFTDLNDIEANLYYEIATSRVSVIEEFQKHLDENKKETLLQKYLFDNLWLLNPSWERATAGNHIMEKRVEAEFATVTASLTEEERKGRMDIKYRTGAGKHIIVELKRYNPGYKVNKFTLTEQVEKYTNALRKCLIAAGADSHLIETIVIIGQQFSPEEYKRTCEMLALQNARLIYYDELIHSSLESYSTYLEAQKEVGRIRKIIDKI